MLAVIRHQEFGDADQQDVARLPVSEGDCRNRWKWSECNKLEKV